MKGTNTQMETKLIHFGTHRGLSQSEENNECENTVKTVTSLLCVHIHLFSSD